VSNDPKKFTIHIQQSSKVHLFTSNSLLTTSITASSVLANA